MAELSKPSAITLRKLHIRELEQLAKAHAPNETCGVLAGRNGVCVEIISVPNIAESPHRYVMQPQGLMQAFWRIELAGWEVLAFFHSHPASAPLPSLTDLAESNYPDTPTLIIGRDGDRMSFRAFLLKGNTYEEIAIYTL